MVESSVKSKCKSKGKSGAKEAKEAKDVRDAIPPHVRRLMIFVSVALHKHVILFSKANQKKLEQWVESVARLHMYDRTAAHRKATTRWLCKSKDDVWKSVQAVFSFESIVRDVSNGAMQAYQDSEEGRLTAAWESFYAQLEETDRH